EVGVGDWQAVGAVDGDVVAVADGGDVDAGPGCADVGSLAQAHGDGTVGGYLAAVQGGVGLDGGAGRPAEAGCGLPGLLRGAAAGQGAVAAFGVVVAPVDLEQQSEFVERFRWGLGGQPFLEGLVVALDLAAGL